MIIDTVRVAPEKAGTDWPFTVPSVAALVGDGLAFTTPVTFLVGENGSGKSTIVEAIAERYGVDARGGASGGHYSSEQAKSPLGEALTIDRGSEGLRMVGEDAKGFFLRSETAMDVFQRHPRQFGTDFLNISHGESFLQTFEQFFDRKGLYLLDEPEAALSFTACLSLIGTLTDLAGTGSQVICATHSPILTTLPGARIIEVGEHGWRESAWDDLEVVAHWQRFLAAPGRYLRHL